MIILGISGFEDLYPIKSRHFYSFQPKDIESLLTFSDSKIPLQFFPLHLIGHDPSAAVIVDGKVIAFASEERFSRIKHGFNLAGRIVLPRHAIAYCMEEAKITWNDIDYIAHYFSFSDKSIRKRLKNVTNNLKPGYRDLVANEYFETFNTRLNKGIIREKFERIAHQEISDDRFIQVPHHLAHASGAFFSSGYDESLILTLDGYGEEESSIWALGEKKVISIGGTIPLPTSLGILYQIISAFLGFRSFGDEYKVMGLSSYGKSKEFQPVFNDLVLLHKNGNYSIQDLSRCDLLPWLKDKFGELPTNDSFSQKKADIAASLQKQLEITLLEQLSSLKSRYHIHNLCISGGVGLNACANGNLLRSGLFKNIHIQPAAGDDGASLGAALYVQNQLDKKFLHRPLEHVYLGPSYNSSLIEKVIVKYPQITWKKSSNIEKITADILGEGKIVGWFQGRMEMGPRALGARSILADPRRIELRDKINLKIKGRELFRPFAPSILKDKASKYFNIPDNISSPFMLFTFETLEQKKQKIAAVVHIDGSARLQTVKKKENPKFYKLLKFFYERTGVPLLLNTSFNRAGEPIVNTPEDALKCFLKSELDALAMEDYLIFPRHKNN